MSKVGFLTAVSFGNQPQSVSQSLLETVDSYFHLWGKKACVIPGHAERASEGAILTEDPSSFIMTAVKIASYFIIGINGIGIVLAAKIVLRYTHDFHLIDAKQKLEEGVNISPQAIADIQRLMPQILERKEVDDLHWYTSNVNCVFSLTATPGFVFKMIPLNNGVVRRGRTLWSEEATQERFANMVKAKEVCLVHQLGLLTIPRAKIVEVEARGHKYTLIAEERLNVNPNASAQEQHYQELPGLNETARQLATFIAKTGFSDVEWRNIPLLDDAPQFLGERRVALVDLEEMESADIGIFGGGFGRRGLIRCLTTEEQMDKALTEVRRHGIVVQEQVKARRLQEVAADRTLQQFYTKNGILQNPRKQIKIEDLNSLGLQRLEETEYVNMPSDTHRGAASRRESITLRDVASDIIEEINSAIAKAPDSASTKAKRYILLNTNDGLLGSYLRLGIPGNTLITSDAQENQRWIQRVINALVEKGHLFKLDKVNGHGYYIQA